MGAVNFGILENEVEYLVRKMELDVFVEGGTYRGGGTAKKMSEKFRITVEKSTAMYAEAQKNLELIDNIILLNGDTENIWRTF